MQTKRYIAIARHPTKRLVTIKRQFKAVCLWHAKDLANVYLPRGWEITVEAA